MPVVFDEIVGEIQRQPEAGAPEANHSPGEGAEGQPAVPFSPGLDAFAQQLRELERRQARLRAD